MTKQKSNTRSPERTRAQLLAAGERLFAQKGYDATSLDTLAREAGVNKAMVSYHFGGKQGLYNALLLEVLQPLVEQVRLLRETPGSAGDRLRGFIRLFGETHARRPFLSSLVLRELLAGGHRLEMSALPQFLAVFGVLSEILQQGVREGSFRPTHPMITHLQLMGSLVFFFATAGFRERMGRAGQFPVTQIDPELFVQHLEALALDGIGARPAPGEEASQ